MPSLEPATFLNERPTARSYKDQSAQPTYYHTNTEIHHSPRAATMRTLYPDYFLYLFLIGICFTLAFNSPSMKYTHPTTTDKFDILDTNIEYLSRIAMRLDLQLEIIYFGFLAAFFYLGFCYGSMQRKVRKLEGEVEEWVKVVTGLNSGQMHPAYGTISTGLESTVRSLVRAETDRRNNASRVEASQKEIKELRELRGLQGKVSMNEEPVWRQFGLSFTPNILASQRKPTCKEGGGDSS